MAERVKLIMPNGKDEVEVWDEDVEHYEGYGYQVKGHKPKQSKKGGQK